MAAPNIVNVTTITGKTAVQAVGTSATAIVTNSSGSGKVFKVNLLLLANIDGAANVDATIDLYRGGTAYKIGHTILVPADASFDVLSAPLYLEEGDALRLTASAAGDLDAVCSYEEIS